MKSTHTHHIIPRHAGGTNDPENLIELTIEEHADAHRVLYEKNGHVYDLIAWKCLLGQIDVQESRRLMMTFNNPMKNPDIVAKHVSNRKINDGYKTSTFNTNNPMKNPEVCKKLSGENHWSRKEGAIHNAKINHPRGSRKCVEVYGVVYDSIKEAAQALGFDVRKIKRIGKIISKDAVATKKAMGESLDCACEDNK